jgi:hypothetical protein
MTAGSFFPFSYQFGPAPAGRGDNPAVRTILCIVYYDYSHRPPLLTLAKFHSRKE